MTAPARRDWPALLAELEAAGISAYRVGLMLEPPCQFSQVKRWASRTLWENGTEPSHWLGEQILAIHAAYTLHTVPRETDSVKIYT